MVRISNAAAEQSARFQVVLATLVENSEQDRQRHFNQLTSLVDRLDHQSLLRKLGAEDYPLSPDAHVKETLRAWQQTLGCSATEAKMAMLQTVRKHDAHDRE